MRNTNDVFSLENHVNLKYRNKRSCKLLREYRANSAVTIVYKSEEETQKLIESIEKLQNKLQNEQNRFSNI